MKEEKLPLTAKKLENLGKMDKFLEKYNIPKLNQEEVESLDRLITASGIEAVIKKLQAQKCPRPEASQAKTTNHLKKN